MVSTEEKLRYDKAASRHKQQCTLSQEGPGLCLQHTLSILARGISKNNGTYLLVVICGMPSRRASFEPAVFSRAGLSE